MTTIPIVNEQDEIIDHKSRETVAGNEIYRVSALWITNSNGDILLAQRSLQEPHNPGQWTAAVAGTIDDGESYYENIIHEAHEELGLTNISPYKSVKQRVRGEWNFFCQWYTLVVDKQVNDFTIDTREVAQIRWFTRDELQQAYKDDPTRFSSNVIELAALLQPDALHTYFLSKYPGKKVIRIPEDTPTEILCETEPSTEHADHSVVIAAIKRSAAHYHIRSTEVYKVLRGKLELYVDGTHFSLREGDTHTIKPGQVHYAEGDYTIISTTSSPGWTPEDHILAP